MFTKTLEEVMKEENGSGMKILVPIVHKLIGMMFSEMKKKGIDISFYEDALGSLLAAWAFEVYDNPKKDFTKYTKIVDDNYEIFAKQMIHEENNKAQA